MRLTRQGCYRGRRRRVTGNRPCQLLSPTASTSPTDVYGEGKPLLFIHGFGSNGKVNWVDTGWVETLVGAGYQAITFDNRGHGRSEKLYDPALYSARIMARDAINLLDHLGIKSRADRLFDGRAHRGLCGHRCAGPRRRPWSSAGWASTWSPGLGDGETIIAALPAEKPRRRQHAGRAAVPHLCRSHRAATTRRSPPAWNRGASR